MDKSRTGQTRLPAPRGGYYVDLPSSQGRLASTLASLRYTNPAANSEEIYDLPVRNPPPSYPIPPEYSFNEPVSLLKEGTRSNSSVRAPVVYSDSAKSAPTQVSAFIAPTNIRLVSAGSGTTGRYSNTEEGRTRFVNDLLPYAAAAASKLGTAPENVLAQWATETGWGNKVLPDSYNLGNIKAGNAWKGPTVNLNALEYTSDGKPIKEPSQFRKYQSWEESARDYAETILNNKRYAAAIGETNPAKYFSALQQGGYATDPNYAKTTTRMVDAVRRRIIPVVAQEDTGIDSVRSSQ